MVDVINYCDGFIEMDTDWKTFTKDKGLQTNIIFLIIYL